MSANAEAVAASATLVLRASFASPRHCQACGAKLLYLGGRAGRAGGATPTIRVPPVFARGRHRATSPSGADHASDGAATWGLEI